MLERTLIVSHLKIINKTPTLSPLEKFLLTPMNDVLSRFRFFVTVVLLLISITNCLLLSVPLISVSK